MHMIIKQEKPNKPPLVSTNYAIPVQDVWRYRFGINYNEPMFFFYANSIILMLFVCSTP